MIQFEESQNPNYPARTIENVTRADATLVFAIDFFSRGEFLAKEICDRYRKPCVRLDLSNLEINLSRLDRCVSELIKCGKRDIIINIAGNGTYTKGMISQPVLDIFIYKFLFELVECLKKRGIRILLIRSGGQSGSDEAGLKAAVKLEIPAICLAPRGWRWSSKEGLEVYGEEKFKSRFKI